MEKEGVEYEELGSGGVGHSSEMSVTRRLISILHIHDFPDGSEAGERRESVSYWL